MENNYYSQQQYNPYGQPQYNQPYGQPQYVQQPIDPNYEEKTKSLLTKAIVACALAAMPIASIVSIIMGSKNRKDVLEYINQCGQHTVKLKVCSCLSRAAKYAGIGYTIFWGFYAMYFGSFMLATIISVITAYNS
jgi:hypothetical protein